MFVTRSRDLVIASVTVGQERRDDRTTLGQHDVVGAAGRARVHDLEADLRLVECCEHLAPRKHLAHAGADQEHLGFERKRRFEVGHLELRDVPWRPVLDQRFRAYDHAARTVALADPEACGRVSANDVRDLGASTVRFIAFLPNRHGGHRATEESFDTVTQSSVA